MWFFKNINTFENFLISIKSKKNIRDANKRNVITHTRKSAKIHVTVGQ